MVVWFSFVFAVIIKTFRARKKNLEVSNEKLFVVVVIIVFDLSENEWMNEWKKRTRTRTQFTWETNK